MLDMFLIRIRFGVGFADALGDDLGKAFAVAGILAILALHARRVFEEFSTKGTPHDGVELLDDEFVTKLLMDSFLTLANGALAIEADVKRSPVRFLFCCWR